MPRMTEKSIVRPSDLFRELEKVRRQGFAIDDEEACMGLRCIAAVVYNDCSEPLAAIRCQAYDQPHYRRSFAHAG